MKRKIFKSIFTFTLLLIISSVFFVGCKPTLENVWGKTISFFTNNSNEKDKFVTLEQAKLVSHVTSGIIQPDESITLRFVDSIIPTEKVGSEEKKVFSFSPKISGHTEWKDRRTLVFIPDENLPLREEYVCKVDLNNFAEEKLEKSILAFDFRVSGREIANLEGDFKLLQNNNQKDVFFQGKVSFNIQTSIDDVKKSISFENASKEIPLELSSLENDKYNFIFKTKETITREDATKFFKLVVNKKALNLSQNFEKDYKLESINTMAITDIDTVKQQEEKAIKIKFSDEIEQTQDITGLVSVKPATNLNLRVVEDSVLVTGNFTSGNKYTLAVSSGINSKWGTKTDKKLEETVSFQDVNPEIKFSNDGCFLPSANKQKFLFKTVNISKVKVKIDKVFESNLGYFLHTEELKSKQIDNYGYDYYNLKRVGVTIAEQTLDIGGDKNKWLQHEIDIKNLVNPKEKGLFLVELSFSKDGMMYNFDENSKSDDYYYGDEYYSNPNSDGYIYEHGQIYKTLVLSDIGLTYKSGDNKQVVYANNILDTKPIKDVLVTLRSNQNQVLKTAKTDGDGKAVFEDIKDEVFYVEGDYKDQKSFVKLNDMIWNLSTFDADGEALLPTGIRAYIYTERGVYRPGDTINLSVIARNQDNTFPKDHPVNLKIYNPKNQLIFTQTNKNATDGFYNFEFATKETDMTGNWRAELLVGSQTFYHTLKIETVVPNRLKVKFDSQIKEIKSNNKTLKFNLQANYLFGNPASNSNVTINSIISNAEKTFSSYKTYKFVNESVDFGNITTNIFDGKLDSNGNKSISWNLPALNNVPSSVNATITAKVFEKGGRFTKNEMILPVSPYAYYVGLERPETEYGYFQTNSEMKINTVVVNENGQIASNRKLNYRIYKNNQHWWWEYDSHDKFKIHYKDDSETQLIEENQVFSESKPTYVSFKPQTSGEYLIEVQDGSNGHISSFFFSVSSYGELPTNPKGQDIITLKTDKPSYQVGEKAIVQFPIPSKGAYLVSIERGNDILDSYWYKPNFGKKDAKIEIDITEKMVPTSYFTISIIQPHEQSVNDRPIRMYGVVPLNVEDKSTHQDITINMKNELESNKPFSVEVQTNDKKQTQFTIAVVDEGLLDITRFETPNPWKDFYRKLRLGVMSYDLFNFVIGANKGDIFKTFSIGGDVYISEQEEEVKNRRFKPISLFKGPILTDAHGYAKIDFDMSEYVGSVRVMVVGANGKKYSSAEKTVPVKSDIMVLPTIPRVLGVDDLVNIPITVFVMKDSIKNVNVSLKTEGALEILGEANKSLAFNKVGDKDVKFQIKAKQEVGDAKIIITASSNGFTVTNTTDINIRPYSSKVFDVIEKKVPIGTSVNFTIPNRGILGSNNATISILRRPNLNIKSRLEWLIVYPYGCIEQTVSSAFPQLFLKDFIKDSKENNKEIDENINAAIKRLRKFLTPSGGFSYWPGESEPSIWGTNYAGHFLVEADKLGYDVPSDLLETWIRFQKSKSITTNDNLLERTYRVYLLALSGSPQMGAMNLLKENSLKDMNDTEKWLLASAYTLAGAEQTATNIINNAGTTVKQYTELSGTYGSTIRDKSIILESAIILGKEDIAKKIYDDIALQLSSKTWYSTQTIGYSLMAVGKYLRANEFNANKQNNIIAGYITLPDGKKVSFDTKELKYSYDLTSNVGKNIQIFIDSKTNLKNAYVLLEWSGIPLKPDVENISKNIALKTEWLSETGEKINPASLKQGKTFWAVFKVKNLSDIDVQELALEQILPSGWEIENTRLTQEDLPDWLNKFRPNRAKYFDIRDDRAMWFFDLPKEQEYIFAVKLNAITEGKFILPPAIAQAMYNNNFVSITSAQNVVVTGK